MRESAKGVETMERIFSTYDYPAGLLERFDQLECLASGIDRQTFLMRQKEDGRLAVAKCYDRAAYGTLLEGADPIEGLEHPGLPRFLCRFSNGQWVCVVREFIPGIPLSEASPGLSREEVLDIALQLCDILIYLHSREKPVIHRDVKPENVILREDGRICLIDFDISRIFKPEAETDTRFFGTRGYAPPEQYGFSQTDARTDEYAFGVLLRFLLTGSVREDAGRVTDRRLERIIRRCTAFAPEKRYRDMGAVKRALLAAEPEKRRLRRWGIALGALILLGLGCFAGTQFYRQAARMPFGEGATPAYFTNEELVADALVYMRETYGTELFNDAGEVATVGLLRQAMMELYGLPRDYVYGINTEMPQESDEFFLPWGWDDGQTVDRDVMVYAAVKVHDPALVADWSSLQDDNGYYPGVRVAVAYAEETGITEGVNRPLDITRGEMALILANTDRVFADRKS